MNGFEEYTLIIGVLSIIVEVIKYIRKSLKSKIEHS